MKKLEIIDFSLEHTIKSGQFFLFEKINDFYYIINGNDVFKIKQEANILIYDNISEEKLKHFFNLDLNFKSIISDFDDEHLLIALKKYWGLRIINQDLWQCIIGFVCSSCSNIPKIQMNMKLISKFFGKKVILDRNEFYTFPKVGEINDLDKLVKAKTGYRAGYIFQINNIVNNNFLDELKKLNYKDAKEKLMSLPGIGSKVANCICIYGLGLDDAFPIDTWIKQVLEQLYLNGEKRTIKELERFIDEKFKTNRGLKQQYLFHYARNNLK